MPFIFEDEETLRSVAVHVHIPVNLTTKETLLSTISAQLNFPDYFDQNWDAFEECVRDLSWLPTGQVLLRHADLPLANDPRDARIYLAILADAAKKLSKSDNHPLLIVFPTTLQDQVSWLLRLDRLF